MHYCGGYALLWWIRTTVVLFFAYWCGYEIITKFYRSSKKKPQNPPRYAKNTTTVVRIHHSSVYRLASVSNAMCLLPRA